MKAAVLHGNGDIRYEEYREPETRPGTVKIRVRATGICGSDIPRALHGGAHSYPIVLGHEFSGDIVEIGEDVSGLSVGDTVAVTPLLPCFRCDDCQNGNFSLCAHYSFIGSREQGSLAEYIVVPERNAVKYDSSVGYAQAAFFEPSTVALHGLFCAGYKGGESVAILGGGTIGLFAMQWAKILGASKVTVFDIDDGRLALAKRLGADETFNPASGAISKNAFKYVFETAGSPHTMKMAFDTAQNKATVCFIGTPSVPVTFQPREWENLNRKEMYVTGSWMSYSAPFPGREWEMTAQYFGTGELRFDNSLIFKVFSLEKTPEAFALFHNPSDIHGKVLIINN